QEWIQLCAHQMPRPMRRSWQVATLSIAAALLRTGVAGGQCIASLTPAGAGTIVGVVMDNRRTPLDSVDVYIQAEKRKTTTDANGAFKFDKLKPGQYAVGARRFGYSQASHPVTLGDSGAVTAFCLIALPRSIAPVVSS